MGATTAKLRELVEATTIPCEYGGRHIRCSCPRCRAIQSLERGGPALARLVLTLAGELKDVLAVYAPGHETCHDGCAAASAQEALAAVEEL